jgi:tetratricopeptide (TPR) repeat protein
LDIRERVMGPDHPDTAQSLYNLGSLLRAQENYAAARLYYERALAICDRVLGSDHPNTKMVRANLAALADPHEAPLADPDDDTKRGEDV